MPLDLDQLAQQITAGIDADLARDAPLSHLTSYRVGGPAALRVAARTESAVGEALKLIHAAGAPLFVLGGGTNVLVSDEGWDGVVLHLGPCLSGWEFNGRQARVLAGTNLLDLIAAAAGGGLAGMESMAGIPGTVGGALRMNAGAFGQEIEAVTRSVSGFYPDGTPFHARHAEIEFGYRTVPALEKVVITSAVFEFEPGDAQALQRQMQAIIHRRSEKQPLEYPSCGSVFKRPPGHYAGKLIQEAGLKGTSIGGATVSPKHAGFIVNQRGATAADILRLIRRVESVVWRRFGVRLEREVKLVGNFTRLKED